MKINASNLLVWPYNCRSFSLVLCCRTSCCITKTEPYLSTIGRKLGALNRFCGNSSCSQCICLWKVCVWSCDPDCVCLGYQVQDPKLSIHLLLFFWSLSIAVLLLLDMLYCYMCKIPALQLPLPAFQVLCPVCPQQIHTQPQVPYYWLSKSFHLKDLFIFFALYIVAFSYTKLLRY